MVSELALEGEYRDQAAAVAFELGVNLSQYGQARLGLYCGQHRYSLSAGLIYLPSGDVGSGGVQASLRIDQLDSVSFGRSG